MPPSSPALFAFACLFLASLSLLAGWHRPAQALAVSCLASAWASGLLGVAGLPACAVATGLITLHAGLPAHHRLIAGLSVVLALTAALHLLPGFQVLRWTEHFGRNGDQLLRWQLDKGLAGLLLLFIFLRSKPAPGPWRRQLAVLLVCCASVPLLAWALGLARPAPAWLPFALVWVSGNLFLTVVAEEALFRLCVQQALQRLLSRHTRHALPVAIVLSALIFALVHAPWGLGFAALAGVAGVAYAWLGRRPELLPWSISGHVATNASILLLMQSPFG